MDINYKKKVHNPWETANPFSKFFFVWIIPLFHKGFSIELSIDDLYDTPLVHTSKYGVDKLQKAWNKVQASAKQSSVSPRLWKALANVHRLPFCIFWIIAAFDELFIRVMQPIYLRKLVYSFNDPDALKSDQAMYTAVVCLCALGHDLLIHQAVHLMYRAGTSCRTALSALIFRKALKLRQEEKSIGSLLNLLSNDLSRFDYQLTFLPYIFIGPLQLIILIYILYDEMGLSAFASAGFVLLILPTQVLNGRLASKFRLAVAQQTDTRSRIMNEILIAIRVIKLFAWEKPFSKLIDRVRKLEVKELGKRAYLKGFFLSMYTFSTRLSSFFVILAYVLSGNQITADKAFFSVAISLTIVETMVFYFSTAISGLAEVIVSISRAEKFLLLPEQKSNNSIILDENEKFKKSNSQIILQNVSAKWSESSKMTLENINLSITGENKLVMVIGLVGSGKSSLLHLLLSELPLLDGKMSISGRVSYAAQEQFIFPADVRTNILFGEAFDYDWYEKVVTACALKDDFNQLPNGDLSIVGERGITLSGGQRARISLARSLYKKSDIWLVDDPLSALDARIGRHIFDKALKTFQGIVILISHQINFIQYADYVVVLNNGRIHAQGTYANLIKENVDFLSILKNNTTDPQNLIRKASLAVHETETHALKEFEKPEENFEKMTHGSVSIKTYWAYIKSANSYPHLLLCVFLFLCGQILLTSCEFWLSYWTDAEEVHHLKERETSNETISKLAIFDSSNYLGESTFTIVYSILVTCLFIFTISKAFGFFSYCLKISNNLHNKMFKAVVRAPTKFFDVNPNGRVLNRFTKDTGACDELLPAAFFDTIEYSLQMLGVIVVIVISNFYLIIPTIVIFIIFWVLRICFIRTSKDVKRLESIWKSPVFTHVASSLQGLTTIRALGAQDRLISQFDEKQDIHTATWFAFISSTRCFAVWAETTGILFLTIISFSFLLFSEETTGGVVGLVITSTLALSVNIQWAIRQSAETENHMTSVERVLEYTKLTPEAELEIPDKKPPSDWPSFGEIKFQNVFLNYENKDVLKNLNFEIRPSEKIAITGRTGAGKSSIITALFRMTEPTGKIFIDGIEINQIGLHDLRKSISIIPQEPVLFFGSLRYNLDPFEQFSDSQLWEAIEQAGLKDACPALDFKVEDGGGNFSVGQKQLICLARALLRKNKILVLDEATANVDPGTDAFIQNILKKRFSHCTVITIAHRLQSTMESDRIIVMDAGEIMEYDHPHILLQKTDGYFSKLVDHTGKSSSEMLRQMAKSNYDKKHLSS